jgi:hypothetical protein
MTRDNLLDNASDVAYGRVAPYVPKHKTRKMQNVTFIVAFWLPDWKPSYTYADTWLSYEVGTTYYKVFNPQRFAFRTDDLISYLVQWHLLYGDSKPVNFEIMNSE